MHGNKKLPFTPAHLIKFEKKEETPHNVSLKDLNKHFTCPLCDGYLVDATAIVECLHTFCKSCIVKYFLTEKENKANLAIASITCPVCDMRVSETMPLSSLHFDRTLQDIINKLLPEVAANEEKRRVDFYTHRPDLLNHDWRNKTLEIKRSSSPMSLVPGGRSSTPLGKKDNSVISLTTHFELKKIKSILPTKTYNNEPLIPFKIIGSLEKRMPDSPTKSDDGKSEFFGEQENVLTIQKYVRCSERSTISQLSQMIHLKYLDKIESPRISIYLSDHKLNPELTIKQVAIMSTLLSNEDRETPQTKDIVQETILLEKMDTDLPVDSDSPEILVGVKDQVYESLNELQPFPYFTLKFMYS